MLTAEMRQVAFSAIPLKDENVQVVPVESLPELVRQYPQATVYILWPEHKEYLHVLKDSAKVYVLGNHKNDMEELRAALKAGAEDYLDRRSVLDESLQSNEQVLNTLSPVQQKPTVAKEEHVIRLSPRQKLTFSPTPRIELNANQKVEAVVQQQIVEPSRPTSHNNDHTLILKQSQPEPPLNYSRLDELHIRPIGGRQMFVVTSTKGGIGKTTVAMNLARLLHDHANGRVILVDLMHPHSNVATRMRIKTEVNLKTWEPYYENNMLVTDQVILTKLVVKHPNGQYVLPGVNVGESCSPELIGYILTHLSRTFDYVVIDIGPERQDLLSVAMSMANRTLLVVDYDLATIKDTQEYLELWSRRQQFLDKISVLVNFEPNKKDRNTLTREKCKVYLSGLPIIGFLPETAGMRAIHNEGKVLVQEDRSHPFSVVLIKVVESLVSGFSVKEKLGFFARLFGGKKS